MRRVWLPWQFFCLALALGACTDDDLRGLQASLLVEPKEIDFGIVYLGHKGEAVIEIENRGSASGTITFVELPEGVVVRPQKLPIGPRAKDFAKVEFRPEAEAEIEGEIVFLEGKNRHVVLVRGRALSAPLAFPPILDFGRVRIGGSETLLLPLENRLETALTVTMRGATAGTAARYEFSIHEFDIEAGGTVEVPIVFRPTGDGGRQDGMIELRCEDCPTMEVALLGEAAKVELGFDPYPIVFADVPPGDIGELPVRVENVGPVFTGELRFEMEKGTRFSVRPLKVPSLGPGEWAQIFLEYEAPLDFLTDVAELRVFSGGAKVAAVPVTAKVIGTELAIRGPLEDMVAPVGWEGGLPYAWRIDVTNVGTREIVPLTVTIAGPDADAFEVVAIDDGVAEAGVAEPYRLFFRPQREGAHMAIFQVEGDGRERTLPLQAWGNLPLAQCSEVEPLLQVAKPITLRGWDASPHPMSRCSWAVREAPAGFRGDPSSPTACTTEFTPNIVGEYELELTLKDDAGNESKCVQAFEARPFQALWVELHWENPSDVDLYLLNTALGNPNEKGHWQSTASCFFANCRENMKALDWGEGPENRPILDVDDVSGIGPENINIQEAHIDALYAFGVHWFDRKGQASTGATVNVFCNGEKQGSTRVLLNEHKLFYRLGEIQFEEGGCTVTEEVVAWPGFGTMP